MERAADELAELIFDLIETKTPLTKQHVREIILAQLHRNMGALMLALAGASAGCFPGRCIMKMMGQILGQNRLMEEICGSTCGQKRFCSPEFGAECAAALEEVLAKAHENPPPRIVVLTGCGMTGQVYASDPAFKLEQIDMEPATERERVELARRLDDIDAEVRSKRLFQLH